MYWYFNKLRINEKIMKQNKLIKPNSGKILVKKIAKSPYEKDRAKLIRDFIRHQDCDPRSYFSCNIESKILLHEIKNSGSVSKWVSCQSDLLQILASIRDSASRQK